MESTENAKGMHIEIGCMDWRLNNGIFTGMSLRNAGANVEGLHASISHLLITHDVRRITVYTHTDCKAMGLVYGVLKEGMVVRDDVRETLIKPFENLQFSSLKELEELNGRVQKQALERILKDRNDIKVEVKLVDVHDIVHQHVEGVSPEKTVMIMRPSERKLSDIVPGGDTTYRYVLQSTYFDEIKPDAEIARSIGIRNFQFVALARETNPRELQQDMKRMDVAWASIPESSRPKVKLVHA